MKKVIKHKRVILTMDITFTEDELKDLKNEGYNTDSEEDINRYCYNVAEETLLERDLDYFDWAIQDVYVSRYDFDCEDEIL